MIRTPDVPTREIKEADPVKVEEEKEWLERKRKGIIKSSTTDGGWVLSVGISLLIAFVIGGSIGALIASFTYNFISLLLPPILIFLISIYFISSDYATVDIDPERHLIMYEGAINYGGEYRSVRYRGSIKIIEGVQLIRKLKFLGKSDPMLRFVTKSGYMRANYKPEEEPEFLGALEDVGLLERKKLASSLEQSEPIKKTDNYEMYYEKRFDRSEYFAKLKKQREEKRNAKKQKREKKRQKALEKSKKKQ